MKILMRLIIATGTLVGGATAASAADIEIQLKNAYNSVSSISKKSLTCSGASCSNFYSISKGSTRELRANINTSASSAMLIFEYGTYNKKCRATIRVNSNNGTPTSIAGSPSFLKSAGPIGELPDCDVLSNAVVSNGVAKWSLQMRVND